MGLWGKPTCHHYGCRSEPKIQIGKDYWCEEHRMEAPRIEVLRGGVRRLEDEDGRHQ